MFGQELGLCEIKVLPKDLQAKAMKGHINELFQKKDFYLIVDDVACCPMDQLDDSELIDRVRASIRLIFYREELNRALIEHEWLKKISLAAQKIGMNKEQFLNELNEINFIEYAGKRDVLPDNIEEMVETVASMGLSKQDYLASVKKTTKRMQDKNPLHKKVLVAVAYFQLPVDGSKLIEFADRSLKYDNIGKGCNGYEMIKELGLDIGQAREVIVSIYRKDIYCGWRTKRRISKIARNELGIKI